MKRIRALATGIAVLLAGAAAAQPAVPVDPGDHPESITMAPDGTLILGSMTAPVVWRAKPGTAKPDIFIDMRPDKAAFLLGVLADAPSHTLWVCEILNMDHSSPLLRAKSVLRAFDLQSGKPKGRWPLPGDNNVCNDFTVAPDHTLYVSDTTDGRILRLRPGGAALETVLQDPALYGVDGITLLDGALYVNTVWSNDIFRIPLDASGKAGKPVQILLSRTMKSPDGMRAAHGRLFVAENAGNQVDMVTIHGDSGTVTTLRKGLEAPTTVEPAGDTLWIGDRGASKVYALPMPK